MNHLPSIKKNYLYNTAFTAANFLFPLITFPYVARVLGPVYIGKVSFAESIVTYFVIFASLGIPLYGIREIAKVRDNKEALSRTFSELFVINLLAMLLSAFLYIGFFLSVEKIQAEKILFLVVGLNIVLSIFSIDWLFKGLENYRYITIRSLIFKIVSAGFLFLLVKSVNDYVYYAGINVIAISGANILNMLHSRNYVKIVLKKIQLKKHLKPILVIFSTVIAIKIYINLDKVMLGFLAGDEYVGLYTASYKINIILLGIVTSLGAVIVPRISYYLENRMMDEFKELAYKSVHFIVLLSLPFMTGLFLLAEPIIFVFSGRQFQDAMSTVQILTPIILLAGISNFTGIQVLFPGGGEKKLLYSTLLGAFTNFLLNLILIPKFKHNGAAIATLCAEFTVTACQMWMVTKYIRIQWLDKRNLVYFLCSLCVGVAVYFMKYPIHNQVLYMVASILIGGLLYISLLVVFRDPLMTEILTIFLKQAKISYLKLKRV